MTKTTEELKKRYRKAFGYGLWEDAEKGMISRDHEVLTFIQSEIEAAERRRTEEVIEFLKELGKEDEGDFWDMAYSGIAEDIKDKFLKNPEQ